MLAFFRRQKWLWVVLIAVFSFALVVGLVPMGQLGHVHFTTDVARVGTEAVSAGEFQTAYYNAVNQMGAGMTPEILKSIGFEMQIVDQLVNQYSLIAEAKRLGLNVSGAEIERTVLENPSFQENGAFIGLSRYQDLLIQNGYTVVDYENTVRNELLMAKLYNYLTAAATVSDEDVETEYRYQNERVQLDYVVLDGPSLEGQINPTDDELDQYYQTNVARYSVPEKRRARYVYIDTVRIESEIEVAEDDVLTYYEDRQQEYLVPASVNAQHILFRTQDVTENDIEEVRDRARDVLNRAKSGDDFGDLAREFSEDTSASAGGDLGTFGPGQMVPEFEVAAFALGEGATSDLVETEFGIHIIRVNEKQEEQSRPLEEVRASIETILKSEAAAAQSAAVSQRVAVALATSSDLDAVAEAHGAEVRETELSAQGAGFDGLPDSAELENRIYSMALNETGTAVAVASGYVVATVVEIEPTRIATFEESVEQVRRELRAERASELATEKAIEVREMVDQGLELAQLAAELGLEAQTSDLITRDGFIDPFGSTTELDDQIFNMELDTVGTPVSVAGKTIVFKVTQHEDIAPEAMQTAFEDLREELLTAKRGQLFDAYGQEVRIRMEEGGDIEVDAALVEEILSGTGHFI